MHPDLQKVLEAMERKGEYVALTRCGKPFSIKEVRRVGRGSMTAARSHAAWFEKDVGRHAEAGASTREVIAALGHANIELAEIYTRLAEQRDSPRRASKSRLDDPG